MSDQDRVIVVGGGVIGAACAYYLAREGRAVTIVDQQAFGRGCSHGNCGFVCPSHVLPLAAPGVVRQALKMVFRRGSPLYVRPRWDWRLWAWMWGFARCCRPDTMLASAHACHALLQSSLTLYRQLLEDEQIACEWQERGLLFVYRDVEEFEAFERTSELLQREFQVQAQPYSGEELTRLEPALRPGLGGGWHFPGDVHLRPDKLMAGWRTVLQRMGVDVQEACTVQRLTIEAGRFRAVETNHGSLAGAACVMATGAWTPWLNRQLGCRIPIQPGKGYSLTMPRPEPCPQIPLILEQHRVAVTPLQSGYRLGSTMEFSGYDTSLPPVRLQLLRDAAACYLRQPVCEPVQETWYGWRPMTCDGKPFIDRCPVASNVFVAAGHNMLGLSMAPATGKLMAALVNDGPPHLDLQPYRLQRNQAR